MTQNVRETSPRLLLPGFLAVLAVLFAVAYTAGRLAGPVAPGMHARGPEPARTAPADPGFPGMDMP